MPFARSRTETERTHLAAMGPRRYAAVVLIYNIGLAHPEVFPPTFDITMFTKSWDLVHALDEIIAALEKLTNLFVDTRILAGSDLYNNAMQAYGFEKSADKGGDSAIHDSVAQVALLLSHSAHQSVAIALPGKGSATITDMDVTKKLFNSGNTQISLRQESAPLATAVLLNPFIAFDIPPTWKVMVVTNQVDDPGSFIYTHKP